MSRKSHITQLPMPKFKRIEGNWRCTSDRRIYAIQGGHPEDDRYIATATSIDDAITLCDEHNKTDTKPSRTESGNQEHGRTNRC